MNITFTGKDALTKAYMHFARDARYSILKVQTKENFAEARSAFNRMFTRIEAAGGIVRNKNEDFLFIKRLGMWDLPKGKLNKNESAEKGALREVTEETGLSELRITRQLDSSYHIYTDRKGKEILKETYWFEMVSEKEQKPVPQTEEDITEVKWFKRIELNIPMQNTYASLRYLIEIYTQQ